MRANWRRSPAHYPCLRLGPAWWFLDSPEGMRRFRELTTETAGFYNTVGFNDDTRAFLSIPARHDVARRVDCAYLARAGCRTPAGRGRGATRSRAISPTASQRRLTGSEQMTTRRPRGTTKRFWAVTRHAHLPRHLIGGSAARAGAPHAAFVRPGLRRDAGAVDRRSTINVIDVAGNLALTQKAIEKYRADHAKTVSRITFTKAPAPELAGKIKAQQNAGRVDIDLVLTGTDGLAAGIEQGLWIELLPKYADKSGNLEGKYLAGAAKMQKLAENKGITVAYYPSGPLLEYMPEKVKQPPQTARGAARLGARPIPTASCTRGPPIRGRAAPSSWVFPTSSATRTQRIRRRAGTRPGRT